MNNENVRLEDLKANLTRNDSVCEHVLLVQDTCQYNFDTFEGRFKDDDAHIGVLADDKSLGIHAHAGLAFDARTGLPVGFDDLDLYTLARDRKTKHERKYQNLPIEEKKSFRWITAVNNS